MVEVLGDVLQVELLGGLERAHEQDLGPGQLLVVDPLLVEFPRSHFSRPCRHEPKQGPLQQVLEQVNEGQNPRACSNDNVEALGSWPQP